MKWIERFEWGRSVCGERGENLLREKSEKWIWFRAQHINRNHSSMDPGAIEICRALNLNRSESVKVDKNTSMDREAVEKLSRWNPEISMDWECDKIYQDKKKEGLDRCKSVKYLSRSHRAWRKGFSKKGKTHRDECNMQATQT